MEIPTKYNPQIAEDKWYKYWLDNEMFKSVPDDREPFTIVIPPPNVTGVLHMGHMLNNTIQDVLIRRARMQGKNACWVPGTDHASIATEAKVVAKLKEEGIEKNDISREEFLEHAWEWKEKHGGIILEQLKKLGASCDWDRTSFTMDKHLSESVLSVFVDLYKKGKIYRGVRMVNWDPEAQTTVSDEEVDHKEVQSKLYYLKYKIVKQNEGEEQQWVTIATTRPETILGDTAVCIHPDDDRYKHLKDRKVLIPLINREVPIIQDDYIDMEFGTGALKVTPSHDINDYELGMKHKLDCIDIFNDDGTMSEAAQLFVGKDRDEVRKLIIDPLEKDGHLVKIEDYTNKVGYSQRTNAVIEPKLSKQWFLKMKELAKPALDNVMNDSIKFHPPRFKNIYKHWMENVRDWCVSRQLWWGHRIPAYYINGTDEFVVAENAEEALNQAKIKTGNKRLKLSDLKQDDDVLDTWFSSWLWPISVFDGINYPLNADINYYYPTSDLVTGHDIIFFWVARMIVAGYEYKNTFPYKNVYFTGMVRDGQGRKMSKQLGNSPDPIKLMNEYGADGVRVGMLLCSPAGGDLLFETKKNDNGTTYPLIEQGRNFGNKIWNASRLIQHWDVDEKIEQPRYAKLAIEWFNEKINKTIGLIDHNYTQYRLSDALMDIYRLFWDDFSSWYLEAIKPAYQQPIDKATYNTTVEFLEKLLKLLHPFMPFITEEIWHLIGERELSDCIMTAEMPVAGTYDEAHIKRFEEVKEIISAIRKVRKDNNIPNKETIELKVVAKPFDMHYKELIIKSTNLSAIDFTTEKVPGAITFMVNTTEYSIPVGNKINVKEELKKLNDELKYNEGFLIKLDKKLSNERFVSNAPAKVIDGEKKKKADAETKIKAIKERISGLKQ